MPRLDVLGERVDGGGGCSGGEGERTLLLRRGDGDHRCAERSGDVDGGEPDTAPCARHEHDLAGVHHRAVLQREPRGAVHLEERGAAPEVDRVGQENELFGPGHDVRREGAVAGHGERGRPQPSTPSPSASITLSIRHRVYGGV